jgi:hypothetical protein
MALAAVLLLLAAAMLAPGLVVGPSLDAAVFADVGGRMLHGVTPYLGAWDHKPPGIYLAGAAAQAVLGWLGPWTADWMLSLVATAGIGVAVATALARLGVATWPRALAALGATVLASHYLVALGGGLTEPPATALVAWALVLALRPTSGTSLAIGGALVGLATLLSVQLLPGGLVVIGLAVRQGPALARLRGTVLAALGFAAPLAAAGGWLIATGAMPAALDAVVTYAAAYRASSTDYGPALAGSVAAWTTLASLFMVAPAFLGVTSGWGVARPRRSLVVALAVWIGASLAFFLFQGRFYAHYAIALAVPLGILGGLGFEHVGETLTRVGRPARMTVILLPLVATFLVSVGAGVVSGAMQLALVADGNTRAQAVADRLRDLPAGTLLVWGNEPHLYAVADRAPATRYSYLYPLTTPHYSTAAQIGEVARALADHPPAIIVDAGSAGPGQPGFPPLLIERPIATDGRDLDLLDPLRAFVAARYDLDSIVSGWPIYVLRAPVPTSAAIWSGSLSRSGP